MAAKRETVARETIVLLLLQFSNGLACGGPRAAAAAEKCAFGRKSSTVCV